MPLATAINAGRPGFASRSVAPAAALLRLRRLLERHRQRRLDRMVAATLIGIDHPGLIEDYRTASRRF
ncbi:MAG TPA: hypothetical protein VMB34_15890 [Acetobacteraceae bacterium]|nr:hypothetical protein [Acetobacteraceae bacterium]